MTGPDLIFGAGFIGHNFATVKEVTALLKVLTANKLVRIDTARLYPITNPGQSEKLLGEAKAAEDGFIIDTKINVPPTGDGRGTLKASAIVASVGESFTALGVQQVNVLYCHAPDTETPLQETAAAFNEHSKKHEFKKLGVANFSAAQVEEFVTICEDKGYVKPTVFQGQYNPVCRRPEEDLLPILRKHGIVFNAYSPLAGGFLTGKLTGGDPLDGTRFEEGNMMGAFYKSMFDKPSMHSAVKKLQAIIKPQGIALTEASLRWLVYHSALREGDGVTLGASKMSHLENNTKDIAKGPLPDDVVEGMEEMWKTCKADAP